MDLLARNDLLRLLQFRLECLNENLVVRTSERLKHLLDHIVAVAIFEEAQQIVLAALVLRDHSRHKLATLGLGPTDQAALNNIASELVFAEYEELVLDQRNHLRAIFR